MRLLRNWTSGLRLVWCSLPLLLFTLSCREEKVTSNQPPAIFTPSLYKSWKAVKVIQGQTDMSANFSMFRILITAPPGGSSTIPYSVTGNTGLTVWPKSGTFISGGSDTMIRDDQTVLSYKLYSDSLQFNFDYHGSGFVNRQSDLDGSWKMFFIIQ